MNSVNAGRAKCSDQSEGFTPVSHRSKAMSLASCHPGSTKCTSLPSSSKQKRKNRCGYQWREKCQNFEEKAVPALSNWFGVFSPARHTSKINAATAAWVESSRAGWARFSANKATRTLESPKYPSAIHSNAPQVAETAAQALAVRHPNRSACPVHAMALSPL